MWLSFGDAMFFDNATTLFFMYAHMIPFNKEFEKRALGRLHQALEYLNNYLRAHTFLVGHRLTVADISVVSVLYQLFARYIGLDSRKKYGHVLRYYYTIVNQSSLQGIIPVDAELALEDAKYTPPQKAAPPKEDKPKGQGDAAAPKKEEKPKNPLDLLPPSNFSIDTWKRVYSNEDTRSKALPWFYENFDKDGFSIWRFDFKYNDELSQIFMSCNQIGGFFNRLEGSRKYLMGTGGVFGENNNSAIAGVFVLRGKDYVPVLSVAPDLESYQVTPLDLEKPEDKKFFEDMLAWEVTIDGKSWTDGKMFK